MTNKYKEKRLSANLTQIQTAKILQMPTRQIENIEKNDEKPEYESYYKNLELLEKNKEWIKLILTYSLECEKYICDVAKEALKNLGATYYVYVDKNGKIYDYPNEETENLNYCLCKLRFTETDVIPFYDKNTRELFYMFFIENKAEELFKAYSHLNAAEAIKQIKSVDESVYSEIIAYCCCKYYKEYFRVEPLIYNSFLDSQLDYK